MFIHIISIFKFSLTPSMILSSISAPDYWKKCPYFWLEQGDIMGRVSWQHHLDPMNVHSLIVDLD